MASLPRPKRARFGAAPAGAFASLLRRLDAGGTPPSQATASAAVRLDSFGWRGARQTAERDANRHCGADRRQRGPRRVGDRQVGDACDDRSRHVGQRDADRAAADHHRGGLRQELRREIAAARAHRQAQADLAASGGERRRLQERDQEPRRQQRRAADSRRQRGAQAVMLA